MLRNTMLLSCLLIEVLRKASEHGNYCCQFCQLKCSKCTEARDCCHCCDLKCSKRPWNTILSSFLIIQAVKKAAEHETVIIFIGCRQQETLEGPGLTRSENYLSHTLAVVSRSPRKARGRPGPKIVNFIRWL